MRDSNLFGLNFWLVHFTRKYEDFFYLFPFPVTLHWKSMNCMIVHFLFFLLTSCYVHLILRKNANLSFLDHLFWRFLPLILFSLFRPHWVELLGSLFVHSSFHSLREESCNPLNFSFTNLITSKNLSKKVWETSVNISWLVLYFSSHSRRSHRLGFFDSCWKRELISDIDDCFLACFFLWTFGGK